MLACDVPVPLCERLGAEGISGLLEVLERPRDESVTTALAACTDRVRVRRTARHRSCPGAEEFRRRRTTVVDGHLVWIVSPGGLVLSKLSWAKDSHSELQLGDVRHIIVAQSGLDWRYLECWAESVSVTELVREVRP